MARSDLTLMAACLTLLLLALLIGPGSIAGADARANIIDGAKGRLNDDTSVTVNFTLDYKVAFGAGFVIAGNISELGNWNTYDAPLMDVISGDSVWSVAVSLAQGTAFEFKPVLVNYDTKDVYEWYSGNNIVYVANSDSLIVLNWPGNTIVKDIM